MTELFGRFPAIPIPYQVSMAYKMWFGFQFNLSDSSDDDLCRLDLGPEGYVDPPLKGVDIITSISKLCIVTFTPTAKSLTIHYGRVLYCLLNLML